MKTILLISPYWKEKHRWMVSSVKLSELWQRLGYRVVVACMGSETKTEKLTDTLTVHSRKDIFLPDPWNYGICFGFSGFVRRLVEEEKPDIIVCNKLLFWPSLAVIPLTLAGHKVTVITDALVGMTWWPRGFVPKLAARIYAWTLGWLILACAKKVVFFHPQPEGLLKTLGVLNKSRVIPTGIDPAAYGRRHETSDVRREGQAEPISQVSSPESVVITYVGRLESVKGVDDFLAAAAPLTEEYPDLKVQVAGNYEEGNPLVRQYEKQVQFLGLRDDVPQILAGTDIFALASYSEGLSNAIMEAMASGCAPVVSDVGGNRYLIQNGISGFLFPAGDREALKSHLQRLIDDPAKRRAMGVAARERIDAEFSWEKVGKMYRELFEGGAMGSTGSP